MSSNHKRFAGVRVLIFDLDGTLIDSKLDLAHSVNAMLAHMGRERNGSREGAGLFSELLSRTHVG